jgi:exodeoxyribonuclease VII large subunit
MFRNSNRRVTFRPQHGQQVLVRANITLYEPRGDYQIIVESMQPAGEGLLQQKYEQLKALLAAEGLFDQQYKQALLPCALRGRHHLENRRGAARYSARAEAPRSVAAGRYLPTAVQGDDAPGQIVRAIEWPTLRKCDVLIVGRGGGSLEDLWSFNDERVARAIFASRIPVVSAVGHETDVTIADFVPTCGRQPLQRPQIVSRNQQELLRQLQSGQQRLEMAMDYFIANRHRRFTQLFHRLQQQHPQLRLVRQQTALERLRQRMRLALETQMKRADQRQQRVIQRLNMQNPQPRIHRRSRAFSNWNTGWRRSIRSRLSERRERFGNAVTHLEAVSPLATLARGYSVTSASDGKVLKQTKQVKAGDMLTTRLNDGWVESEVKTITP